jgi:hypothetical protein
MATSKVENSAQVLSCQLKFVHEESLESPTPTHKCNLLLPTRRRKILRKQRQLSIEKTEISVQLS